MAPRPDVLARAAAHTSSTVAALPVEPGGPWVPLAECCEPDRLRGALREVGQRRSWDDVALVGSAVGRDLLSAVTTLAIAAWVEDDVALDVSSVNLLVDLSGERPRLALRRAEVGDDANVLARLERWLLDDAATCYIGGLRAVTRVGAWHLWGTVALAAVNTVAALDHSREGRSERAARRDLLLQRRPELARLVDIVTIADDDGEALTYAIRRTCCLIVKLPGAGQCGTCSLRPRDERTTTCSRYFLDQRRANAGTGGDG